MFKNEKGLTLIELLITIAVIAIVAAISVPVVSNVIAASNTNSLNAMQEQVDQFVAEATQSGSVTLNGSTLEARIDQNGDGTAEYLVKTFPVDSKYTITEGTGGAYIVSTNGTTSGTQQATGTTYDLTPGGAANVFFGTFYLNMQTAEINDALAALTTGDIITITDTNGNSYNAVFSVTSYVSYDGSGEPKIYNLTGDNVENLEFSVASMTLY